MLIKKLSLVYLFTLLSVFFFFTPTHASTTNGTIDTTYKYAWSENIAWINFYTSSTVTVTDSAITGHAWSPNYGWINMAPSGSGVVNDSEGTLSGQAWGENTGWIDFDGVTIDSSGYFSGYASGTVTGRISMNCSNDSICGSSDFKVRGFVEESVKIGLR